MQLELCSSMFEVSFNATQMFHHKLQLSCVCLQSSEVSSVPSTAATCAVTFNPPSI